MRVHLTLHPARGAAIGAGRYALTVQVTAEDDPSLWRTRRARPGHRVDRGFDQPDRAAAEAQLLQVATALQDCFQTSLRKLSMHVGEEDAAAPVEAKTA